MDKIFEKGINLYGNKQYDEAFDKFVECGEYFSAGMCQVQLKQLDNPINMFILSIDDYQKKGIDEINTPNGASSTLLIYLKLTQLLLKIGDVKLALGALSYGLKENEHMLKKGEIFANLYKDVSATLNCYLTTYDFTGDMDCGNGETILEEFSAFLQRKLKFLSKREKSAFINIEDYEKNEMPSISSVNKSLYKSCMDEVCVTESISNKEKEGVKMEIEFLTTVIILELKNSEYLRVVKYMYKDDNIRYFLNKDTNKLECEQILEDIDIANKNDDEILILKNKIYEKYKITKEILIKNEKSLNV